VEFTLYYRGPLKANAGRKDKHKLREYFHRQLRKLLNQLPLNRHRGLIDSQSGVEIGEVMILGGEEIPTVVRTVGVYTFASVVHSAIDLVADLTITFLRPEPPGAIVTQGGDIDNRIKTFLDALKMPNEPQDIPQGALPSADEHPLFCLLEDDNLITGLNIKTDRWLEPNVPSSQVVLLTHV
jgi:hypothetical protein